VAVRSVHRWEVPVDGYWHAVEYTAAILHVASRRPEMVKFWAITDDRLTPQVREYRVFGTGQPLPPDGEHVGTALAAEGQLVWHLFERDPAASGGGDADG
jgi:hypothetical protein